jgi:hypothetical protein
LFRNAFLFICMTSSEVLSSFLEGDHTIWSL